jgi:hypothetical protein
MDTGIIIAAAVLCIVALALLLTRNINGQMIGTLSFFGTNEYAAH